MASFVGFLRKKENWPILVIPLLLLLWARFAALPVVMGSFNSVSLIKSPYLDALAPGQAGEAVTKQVVIVVVDALRVDASRRMPTLNQLRTQGAHRIVRVGQPSLSLPGWTVIGTGAWQEQNGIASNFTDDSIKLDTIFQAAKRKGLTTAIVGSPGWKQLYASGVDTLRTVSEPPDGYTNLAADLRADDDILALALDVLKTKPNLTLVHFLSPDEAGHGWGGASEQYAQAAQHVDGAIAKILAAINLNEAALIVTADHGQIDAGGHGGWEPVVLEVPLVAAGKGIRAGSYPNASQADIAPTLAVLLGTSIPAHSQGDALLDQIDAPDGLKAVRAVDVARQRAARYESMLAVIGDRRGIDRQILNRAEAALTAGQYGEAIALASQSNENAHAQWLAARRDRINRERVGRFVIALILLIPVALYLWWWKRAGWNGRVPVFAAVLYIVLWNVNFFVVRRLSYSLSVFNSEEEIEAFLTMRVMETMLLLVVCMIAVGVLRRRARAGEIARDAVNTVFLVALAMGLQILVFYVLWGVTFSWFLPDLLQGFKYYIDMFQTTAFWPMTYLPVAALLPVIALLAAGVGRLLGRRGSRMKEPHPV